jgi:hypothetical protein
MCRSPEAGILPGNFQAVRPAYISIQSVDGQNYRLKLKNITDIRPLLDPISLVPIGCTIALRDGREIDLNMPIDQIKNQIRWK